MHEQAILHINARMHFQVTCGSSIKLQHDHTKGLLHSHDISYGSGSGQQSVTGSFEANDANSFWIVKAPNHVSRLSPKALRCHHRDPSSLAQPLHPLSEEQLTIGGPSAVGKPSSISSTPFSIPLICPKRSKGEIPTR
jgi:hypothetical protein